MAMSEKTKTALSAAVDPMKAKEHEIIEQYLEQLHADYDPVYSMLLNYECAVMEVETKFNILNNRLSIQGEQNPIESIKSRVKSLDSIIRKLEKLNLPIELESVEKVLPRAGGCDADHAEGLYQESETQRLSEPAPHCPDTDLYGKREKGYVR